MKTILISIGCYEDPDIMKTVVDMYAHALHPERLRIVVILQTDTPELFPLPPYVEVYRFPRSWGTGCGRPRAEVMRLWAGEDYFFQTDSHMRFESNWDELLIQELERCPSDKPVLTTLPPNFVIATGKKQDSVICQLKICAMWEHIPRPQGTQLTGQHDVPPPTPCLAGGVLFTHGKVCMIPYDPYMYFHGEEHVYNMRLWTSGYSNFTPRFNFCYHAYREHQAPNHVTLQSQISKDVERIYHERSLARMHLVTGVKGLHEVNPDYLEDIELYGLGDVRPVSTWEDTYGVNLKEQTFREGTPWYINT